MAFYLRKSFNFGPLRINLSKSGIGLSFGVTGLRVGVKPDGQRYVHAGRKGIYYRKSLGKRHKPAPVLESPRPRWLPPSDIEFPEEIYQPKETAQDFGEEPIRTTFAWLWGKIHEVRLAGDTFWYREMVSEDGCWYPVPQEVVDSILGSLDKENGQ